MSENTKHVSLDLETLGTGPGSVILSIGARVFDPAGDSVPAPDGGPNCFYCTVDVLDQLLMGRAIDPDTLKWWGDQAREAKSGLLKVAGEGVMLRHSMTGALRKLTDFIEQDGLSPVIWANSPSFDCVILRHAYRSVGLVEPWSFRSERDLRTICDAAGVDKREVTVDQHLVAHSALDDAIFQARVVQECHRRLAEGKRP